VKILYVVYACDNKYVDFHGVQVMEETEDGFNILDKVNVENYIHEFPKDKLNVEFDMGYVTDKLDKEKLKIQIDRIYNKLKEKHLKDGEKQYNIVNDRYYTGCLKDLEKCVTPEEYEKSGLKEQEDKEVMEKLKVFFE